MSTTSTTDAAPLDVGASCSYSDAAAVYTTHYHLSLVADFSAHTLRGTATLTMRVDAADGIERVVLDTRALDVERVVDQSAGDDGASPTLRHAIGVHTEAFGAPLTIELAARAPHGARLVLCVHYATSPDASGLQWLAPAQTDERRHPYLFTQFQAIHARSAFPCQDQPAVKASYSAAITVPAPLTALMSALATNYDEQVALHAAKANATADADANANADADATRTFKFEQRVPIPAYLTALVVGHLERREIGPRSAVWCEPPRLAAAAAEFAETEQFLSIAEAITTAYEWGRYDVLMLPGSFPYGGMENPCLTFVTPTLLSGGDRANADVVAHEISHSWFGNLVTNRTWECFWLNEGFTVYLERRIVGNMQGERARHLKALIGHYHLLASVRLYGEEHDFTTLEPVLRNVDPDDAFSSVPYERGFQLLFYLESLVTLEGMERYLKQHVTKYRNSTLMADDFVRDFTAFFADDAAVSEKLKAVDWHAWRRSPGMPPVAVHEMFDRTLATQAEQLAARWLAPGDDAGKGCNTDDIKGWRVDQTRLMLETLMNAESALPLAVARRLGEAYPSLATSKNFELRFPWLIIAINAGDESVIDDAVHMLEQQGRMKFVRPLFRALATRGGKFRTTARETFDRIGDNYHPICKKMVATDLDELCAVDDAAPSADK